MIPDVMVGLDDEFDVSMLQDAVVGEVSVTLVTLVVSAVVVVVTFACEVSAVPVDMADFVVDAG